MLLAGLIVQNLLVCIALVLLSFLEARTRKSLALLIASVGVFLIGLASIGSWLYPPLSFLVILVLAFIAIGAWRWRWLSKTKPGSSSRWHSRLPTILLAASGTAMLLTGIVGRTQPDGETITLRPPFPKGEGFCVLSGGNVLLLNPHYMVGEKTAASFERHSVDFTKVNALGFRTTTEKSWNPKPTAPSEYAIFGEPVFAPCSGKVIEVENSRPDNPAGYANRDVNGANRVVLSCDGVHVWLAHLKQASVYLSRVTTSKSALRSA
uniref:hypothetical protein n=1 Tax=uncultured Altererythrobacter sp. TaxID=500840 RepID=UPI00261DDA66|nr:hypothetical protein [uncultured Altererythrobacter sp.]